MVQKLNDDPIVKQQFLFVWEAVSACPDSKSSGYSSCVTYDDIHCSLHVGAQSQRQPRDINSSCHQVPPWAAEELTSQSLGSYWRSRQHDQCQRVLQVCPPVQVSRVQLFWCVWVGWLLFFYVCYFVVCLLVFPVGLTEALMIISDCCPDTKQCSKELLLSIYIIYYSHLSLVTIIIIVLPCC